MNEYDAIVIGVGGMGSAALYHLAQRGWRALGLEQFDVPHEMGSSHGYSRMIRYTLQEHPSYVPLVRRAYELWHQLENASRERLLVTTGSIRAGYAESEYFQGAVAACEEHHIPYEVLTGPETGRRFPGYRFDHDIAAVYQADGGFLLPERCIVNHVNAALEAGAEVHGRERVLDWEPSGEGVVVRTARDSYRAARLVVSAGPWAARWSRRWHGTPSPSGRCWAGSNRKGRNCSAPTPSPCSDSTPRRGAFTAFRSMAYRASRWAAPTIYTRQQTPTNWTATSTRRMKRCCGASWSVTSRRRPGRRCRSRPVCSPIRRTVISS